MRFLCAPTKLKAVEPLVDRYLAGLGIPKSLLVKRLNVEKGSLVYTLATDPSDTNTLTLSKRPEMDIRDEALRLPMANGKTRKVVTVSKKEIALALMQHGRTTEFAGEACDAEAFIDHIGVRQNTVAWAEKLQWEWPDGTSATWNEKYWARGTPKAGYPLHEAMSDAFIDDKKYSIGCYTATKIVIVQGVLDYYHRVKKDAARTRLVSEHLLRDGEPLVYVEPGIMWNFEKDFEASEAARAGKLLKIYHKVPSNNFVPGDWSYFLNTDPVTYEKTGYEGSNAIYLGRNKYDDYYNDNDHAYTFEQKIDEVYQWRNEVFSRSRDAAKIRPLTPEHAQALTRTPAEGGLLNDMRAVPYAFGFEPLPFVPASQ